MYTKTDKSWMITYFWHTRRNGYRWSLSDSCTALRGCRYDTLRSCRTPLWSRRGCYTGLARTALSSRTHCLTGTRLHNNTQHINQFETQNLNNFVQKQESTKIQNKKQFFFLIMELLVRTYVCKSAGSSKCFEDSRCWRRSWQESDDSRECNRWVCPRSQAHTDTHLYDRQQHTLRWAHTPLPRKHLHRVWSLEFVIPNKSCAADNCLDIMYIFYLTIASIIYERKIYLYLALYYSSQSLFRP